MLKRNQKGFTIIELLVVIVIIGILVALALPNLFAAQARGRDSDRKNELKNLQQKLESHFNDNGEYPSGDMAAAATALGITDTDEYQGPSGGEVYTYAATPSGCDNTATTCTDYTITADLENDDDPDATSGNYVLDGVNQP